MKLQRVHTEELTPVIQVEGLYRKSWWGYNRCMFLVLNHRRPWTVNYGVKFDPLGTKENEEQVTGMTKSSRAQI